MSGISTERWQRASPHLDRLLDLTETWKRFDAARVGEQSATAA